MSAVGRILQEVDQSLQGSDYRQQPLDFLYVKKRSKGFSRVFWSLMGVVSLVYTLLILHWYQAEDHIKETLSHWQYSLLTLSDQQGPVEHQQPILDNRQAAKHQRLTTEQRLTKEKQTQLPGTAAAALKRESASPSDTADSVNESVNQGVNERNQTLGSSKAVGKSDIGIANQITPKQLSTQLQQAKASNQAKLTAGSIERQPQKNQRRVRSQKILLDKTNIEISSPQHLQLYDAAMTAFDSGDLIEANRLVDEALFLKPIQAAHILKLRMLLLSSVQEVIPYIYKHQLSVLESTELLAIYAQANQRSGQYKNAQWAYQKLLQAEPSHEGWFLGLALSLEHLGDMEQAVQYYHQAIQLTQNEQLKRFAKQRVAQLQNLLP